VKTVVHNVAKKGWLPEMQDGEEVYLRRCDVLLCCFNIAVCRRLADGENEGTCMRGRALQYSQ